jgi:methyltransferase family protein
MRKPAMSRDLDTDSLIDAALFSPELLRSPSAWVGHVPLAAWVIREVAPSIFVELGTHTGNSYFSFCQSVVEAGLSTKCYAVDTWHGDEQAGLYDEKVFIEVKAYNEQRYAAFSQLLRMTFDDALGRFADESIGLLHIDGLHTYEAVRHDFETWLPKLVPGGVVMFHDTGVREGNFGVWKLWEELQTQYPDHIEFSHSHGLGILQLNNAPKAGSQKWLRLDRSGRDWLRTYFAVLGLRQVERFELTELTTSRHEVLARDAQITDLRQHASNLEAIIADLRQHASNLEAIIVDLRQHASNLEQELSTRDAHIANLDRAAGERDVQIADLRQQASSLTQELSSRAATIASLVQASTARDDHIANLSRDVDAIRYSTSWRITAPLRWVADGIRKARRRGDATADQTSRPSE